MVDMEKWARIAAQQIHLRKRSAEGRLGGKVVLITGAAQGFGRGIAEELYQEGASVVIADLNLPLAQAAAAELGERAHAVPVDVANEQSVADMVGACVERFFGLDLLISNAGILKAGGLEEMEASDFEKVTAVNYTAFFLCAKYAVIIMKAQRAADPAWTGDIVQINSKSGLEGSNRNFAYAGGKFGGIGLVQSFAMELAPHGIKVNAVCPGNYYDGPLWSDPEKGLFVQYLKAGKVPGARTVEEVRAFYLGKSLIRRGCLPRDVAKAVLYAVEQEYETGQAIPVTGGQVMLR